MIYNSYVCLDLETTSPSPRRTQIVQIAAVVIHSRTLEIKPNSEFNSLVQPSFDSGFCEEHDLDLLQDGAVKVHGKTEAMLKKAPSLKSVWANFIDYVNEYNYKGTNWTAPIAMGYNSKSFDFPILDRVMLDDPWGYGPSNKQGDRQDLFNKYYSVDVMDMMFNLFENDKNVNKLSADALVRGHMGYSKGQAHDAMGDVMMTAELFCKTQRDIRGFAKKKKFKDAFATKGVR
jgi:DNA polymerase III epsilon subunit-like protein